MPIKLRTKIVDIEAELWDGTSEALDKLVAFVTTGELRYDLTAGAPRVQVWNALEQQWLNCPLYSYVIKGLQNEHYPCAPAPLFMKYEEITDEGIDVNDVDMQDIRDA